MATYRLTTASEAKTGSNNADIFDGYKDDDGLGETGGTDTLSGRGGDDLFLLKSEYSLGGLIDGGEGTDTVRAYGFDLGSLTFQNVEVLSVESFEFGASITQLNAFSTITSSLAGLSRIKFYLFDSGGTIDVSGRMALGKAVEFNALGLSSGYNATGTDQADVFKNSNFNDVVHGGLGADSFWGAYQDGSSGGTDQLYGDGGGDIFYLRRQSGTIDGGAGLDTVVAYQVTSGFGSRLGDLGDATFLNVEKLSSGPNITFATIAQLNSFAAITGGNVDKLIQFDVNGGAGGVIDFSTKLKLANEHVWLRAYRATSAVDVTGTARDDILTGSAYDDKLSGGDGNDYLGGADFVTGANGKDTLIGGGGSDTYYVDSTDKLFDLVGPAGGVDTVISTASYDLANTVRLQGEFENLTLSGYLGAENPSTYGYGNGLDNTLTGNGGNNYLDGRAGADHLIGGAGDDRFVVDNAGDVVQENILRNDGIDSVLSSVEFDLGDPNRAIGFVENLTLQGTGSINGFGSESDNKLTGNAGDNVLDGRVGRDVMIGLGGNDTYYVEGVWDRVVEADAGGIDTVYASGSFSLASHFAESLLLIGEDPANGTGNQLNNAIVGNSSNNVINGGGGEDTLTGGDGNDAMNGGAGRDFMIGESGGDVFIFTALIDSGTMLSAADQIHNFASGDKINVRLIDASTTLANDQAFVLDTDASFSEGEIRQMVQGHNVLVEFNADTDVSSEMSILLTSRTTLLTSVDFVL
jgi:Ca2+-binding RTX toxin-like protein